MNYICVANSNFKCQPFDCRTNAYLHNNRSIHPFQKWCPFFFLHVCTVYMHRDSIIDYYCLALCYKAIECVYWQLQVTTLLSQHSRTKERERKREKMRLSRGNDKSSAIAFSVCVRVLCVAQRSQNFMQTKCKLIFMNNWYFNVKSRHNIWTSWQSKWNARRSHRGRGWKGDRKFATKQLKKLPFVWHRWQCGRARISFRLKSFRAETSFPIQLPSDGEKQTETERERKSS